MDSSGHAATSSPIPGRTPATRHTVARNILEFILDRHLRDGEYLPSEAVLAAQLHVSRGILRESLSILESQGVVSIHPGRAGGIRVRRPDIAAVARDFAILLRWEGRGIVEVIEARRMLEVACVRTICANGDFQSAQRLLEAAAAASDRGEVDAGPRSFHHVLVAEAGNWVLLQVYESLRHALYDRIQPPPGMHAHECRICHLAHRRIAAAVASRDSNLAESRLSRHLDGFLRYMLRGRAG